MLTLEECKNSNLVDLPMDMNPISYKWAEKKKFVIDSTLERYKVNSTIKGYLCEICSSTLKLDSICLSLSIDDAFDFEVEELDVKVAFLNRYLQEVNCMDHHNENKG